MGWDSDALSVLPQSWQDDVYENFSAEYVAERLSDYIAILTDIVKNNPELLPKLESGEIMNFDYLKEHENG